MVAACAQVNAEGAVYMRWAEARTILAILTFLLPAGLAGAASEPDTGPLDYADQRNWICRPGHDDVCSRDLSATRIAADGALAVEPLKANPDAPIDCIYVYPTVSRDQSLNSDTDWSDGEERLATYLQAAPLAGGCRVFAPGYRQLTIEGLATNMLPNDVAMATCSRHGATTFNTAITVAA